jgi:hypothetical protein
MAAYSFELLTACEIVQKTLHYVLKFAGAIGMPAKFADIAQWLERLFCKQRVVGSNPSVGST